MTQNQIRLAEHNETVRHNQQTESQGWYSAYELARYQRALNESNALQASAAWYNAETNKRNSDINWYTAVDTSKRGWQREQSVAYDYTMQHQDRQEANANQKEANEIEKKKVTNQAINDLAKINILRGQLYVAQKNSQTDRMNMWFNAANNVVAGAQSLLTGLGKTVGYALG